VEIPALIWWNSSLGRNSSPVGNHWSRRLHFHSFQSKLWSYASAQFRNFWVNNESS